MLTISTRSSPAMMSSVPLPWCTSKSTMATRSRPRTSSACRAATATLLKKQKPIARIARRVVAGRAHRAEGVARHAVDHQRRWPATAAPAARCTAAQVPALAEVSGSTASARPRSAQAQQRVTHLGRHSRCCARGPRQPEVDSAGRRCPFERDIEAGREQVVVDRGQALRALGMAGGPCRARGNRDGCRRRSSSGLRLCAFRVTWPHGRNVWTNTTGKALAAQLTDLIDQISTIIVGKRAQMEDCLACMLAGGHLLIEDVPGVGKTTLAHALAVSLGLAFFAHPVHGRSDAVGPDRRQRLRAQQGDIRLPRRPRLRAGAAGRRDQPRRPEDAERACSKRWKNTR